MKTLLLFVMVIGAAASANSQQLLFKVKQSAESYKNNKIGKFVDAEVNDTEATIFLQDNKVIVQGATKANYILDKKAVQTKVTHNVISYKYSGKDENDAPISFVYTVNLNSKEAVVEVENSNLKNYYFGSYSSSELSTQR
ncbi:hypothetical protein [Segetibacter aerophilus]|nr:hypothetical protein [Segetibacter aerophilus]